MQAIVGGVPCRATHSNDTAIDCVVGPSEAGWAAVKISRRGQGWDANTSSIARVFQVTAVQPSEAGLTGKDAWCIWSTGWPKVEQECIKRDGMRLISSPVW